MRFRRDRPRPVLRGAGPIRGAQGLKSPRPTAVRPRTRIGGPGRRTPRIRRASAGLTPIRAAALLILLAAAAAIYGVSASSAFVARTMSIDGATWTGEAVVRETVGALEGANLFTLRTADLEQRLATLPAVRSALVSVALPDAIGIRLDERKPLLVWQTGADRWLVDREGMVFAKLGDDPPPRLRTSPSSRTSGRRRPRSRSARSSTRSSSTRRSGSAHSPRRTSAAAPPGCASASMTRRASCSTPATAAGPRCSVSIPRRSARPSSSRARSACCAASSPTASPPCRGSSWPMTATGRTSRGSPPGHRQARPGQARSGRHRRRPPSADASATPSPTSTP